MFFKVFAASCSFYLRLLILFAAMSSIAKVGAPSFG